MMTNLKYTPVGFQRVTSSNRDAFVQICYAKLLLVIP